MRGRKLDLGWEHAGRSYTVEWRYTLRDSSGVPACWVARVVDDETGEERRDLMAAAERDCDARTTMTDVLCEAEAEAHEDVAERDADRRMDDERLGA